MLLYAGERRKTLAWSERMRVAIGLSRGLKYLHDNNIIHGNIKPSNILLTHDFKPLVHKLDCCVEYTFSHFMELTLIVNNKHIFSLEILTLERNSKQRSPAIIKA